MTTDPSPMDDLIQALKAARSADCRMAWARRLVAAKADRGDYDAIVQGELGADVRELLAVSIVREMEHE